MKKAVKVAVGLACMCLIGWGITCIVNRSSVKENEAMRVNDISVDSREISLVFDENKMQYDRELCQEGVSEKDADYRERLMEKVIADMSRIKIQQSLAAEKGLMPQFVWETFEEQLEKENSSRGEKLENSQVVYGLTSFGKAEYYTYLLDQTVNVLKSRLTEELGNATEEEMWSCYRDEPEPVLLEGESYRYLMCDISALLEKEDQEKTIDELTEKLSEEKREAGVLKTAAGDFSFKVRSLTQDEMDNLVHSDFNGEMLLQLQEGEISEPISLEGGYWLIRYDGFEKAEELSESDKEVIKGIIAKQRYDAFIDSRVKEAVIETDEALLLEIISEGDS